MKYHAIGPYFVPLLGLVLGVFSFFFQSSQWVDVFGEKNYSYLNLKLMFFLLFTYLVFYCGVILGEAVVGKALFNKNKNFTLTINYPNLFIFPVVFCTILVLTMYLFYLIIVHPGYILLTFTGRGSLAKEMVADDIVNYATILNFAVPVIWWSFYQYCIVSSYRKSTLVKCSIIILFSLLMFLLLVMAARFAMMPLLIGMAVIYSKFFVFDNLNKKNLHFLFSIKIFSLMGAVVVVLFIAIAYSRGANGIDKLWEMVLGYGPASYNRLALMLDDGLHFDYSSTGFYVIPEPFFSIARMVFGLDLISGSDVWLSEFDSVEVSGLNRNFIWATQFGYVFDSLGYFSFLFFLFYGALFGLLWRWFCNGGIFGVIFYPVFYYSIFFAFGNLNFIVYFPYYLFVFTFLVFWTMVITFFHRYLKVSHD